MVGSSEVADLGKRDPLGPIRDASVGSSLTSCLLASPFLTKDLLMQTSLLHSPPFNFPILTPQSLGTRSRSHRVYFCGFCHPFYSDYSGVCVMVLHGGFNLHLPSV